MLGPNIHNARPLILGLYSEEWLRRSEIHVPQLCIIFCVPQNHWVRHHPLRKVGAVRSRNVTLRIDKLSYGKMNPLEKK